MAENETEYSGYEYEGDVGEYQANAGDYAGDYSGEYPETTEYVGEHTEGYAESDNNYYDGIQADEAALFNGRMCMRRAISFLCA